MHVMSDESDNNVGFLRYRGAPSDAFQRDLRAIINKMLTYLPEADG